MISVGVYFNFYLYCYTMAQKIKIMIVEDEAITAMYLHMRLKKLSYDVLKPISTGDIAIQTAKKELPNIILMDIPVVNSNYAFQKRLFQQR